jgi:hypothetical protein
MSSDKWQVKADAVTLMGTKLSELTEGVGKYSAPLVVYLASKTGGFKISNINILKAVIQTACSAATPCGEGKGSSSAFKFSKPAAWELIKHLGDKLSDKKTKVHICMYLFIYMYKNIYMYVNIYINLHR